MEAGCVLAITAAFCLATYEAVRRVPWLRPLFGLKLRPAAEGACCGSNGARRRRTGGPPRRRPVTVAGWPSIASDAAQVSYVLLAPEPACCRGCLPSDPSATVDVLAAAPVLISGAPVTLRGTWRRLHDDPLGWRSRQHDRAKRV